MSIDHQTTSTNEFREEGSNIELSSDFEGSGDPLDLEGDLGDLLELYDVMDATRYFVERPITSKSKEFATQCFACQAFAKGK